MHLPAQDQQVQVRDLFCSNVDFCLLLMKIQFKMIPNLYSNLKVQLCAPDLCQGPPAPQGINDGQDQGPPGSGNIFKNSYKINEIDANKREN